MNLTFAGFGEAIVSTKQQNITSSILCDKTGNPLTALYSMKNGRLRKSSQIVREKSDLMGKNVIKSMIKANSCITCHEKADDDIYGEKIDYEKILNDDIHRDLVNINK